MEKVSVLGLDVGKKRVGVAGCDGTGLIATGLTTIKRTSFQADVEQLREIAEAREVQLLVVGLPYTMAGELGFQARQVQKFSQRISTALDLPIEYVDERLTSVEAEQQMKGQKVSVSRNKATIDRKAAAIILQRWLDKRRTIKG
ncbi:MAG: Holliday junction resolvase RuvX [Spirulinaceae cyanobacterium]